MVKEKLMEKYDWQQRTALLLGEEKMERIRNAHVLVVGLGGVGNGFSVLVPVCVNTQVKSIGALLLEFRIYMTCIVRSFL